MGRRILWLPMVVILLGSCGTDRAEAPTGIAPIGTVSAKCNPLVTDCGGGGGGGGGVPSDPAPSAPGYWLGVNVTPSGCISPTGNGINDIDHDTVSDWCEQLFAEPFRPEMVFSPYDCNTTQEPYWAVRYFSTGGGTIRIMYLLSYHKDCGTPPTIACDISLSAGECSGHEGDSEFITVDIRFNQTTQHWYVDKAFLSAHWNTTGESSTDTRSCLYTSPCTFGPGYPLQWVNKTGGYFRVWSGEGKHSNYTSRSNCNAGGILSLDDCHAHPNTGVRLYHANNRNIGNVAAQLIDCVSSLIPAALRTGTECFWKTGDTFQGWFPLSQPNDATPYRTILNAKFETY